MDSLSYLGYPTTSKSANNTRASTDEETNFDVLDYPEIDSDDDFEDNATPFDKDAFSGDLMNEYEKGIGLDILKGRDVCWVVENVKHEMRRLKNYGGSNDSSLSSFEEESLEFENKDNFSPASPFEENTEQTSHDKPTFIVPKKTMDITKIKGWRNKNFTIERQPDKRAYIMALNPRPENPKPELRDGEEPLDKIEKNEESNNKSAFVCNELDEFLERDAELKIDYEIPHLAAEWGITLTSEDVVSRPKFKPDLESIIPNPFFKSISYEEGQTMNIDQGVNSPIKKPLPKKSRSKSAPPGKSCKTSKETKGKSLAKQGKNSEMAPPRRRNRRSKSSTPNKPKTTSNRGANGKRELKAKGDKTAKENENNSVESAADYKFKVLNVGMVLYPGPNAPLNSYIQFHLQKMRMYETHINKYWANFAATALAVKGKVEKRRRMILPVSCCFKYKNDDAKDTENTDQIDQIMEGDPEPGPSGSQGTIHVDETINDFVDEPGPSGIQGTKHVDETINDFVDEPGPSGIQGTKHVDETINDLVDEPGPSGIQGTKHVDEPINDLVDEACENRETEEVPSKDAVTDLSGGDDSMESEHLSDADVSINTEVKRDREIMYPEVTEDDLERNSADISEVINDDSLDTDDDIFQVKSDFANNLRQVISLDDKANRRVSSNSSQSPLSNDLTKLLVEKFKELKLTKNVDVNVDELKNFAPNTLELIKMNFIKENYTTGYINLWYMKSQRSKRVFLTFCMNPPDKRAINLKMLSRRTLASVPKIMREITIDGFVFDEDDYAIIHCDGENWEIHGSVNFPVDTSEVPENEKRQVFHMASVDIPELAELDRIKKRPEKSRILKWWALHLMEFSKVTVTYQGESGSVAKWILLKALRANESTYIEFKGLKKPRTIGIAMLPVLWPYVLVGPYDLNEYHGLSVKLRGREVPFEYFPSFDTLEPGNVLKRIISSVVKHSWRSGKQVIGICLYDRFGTSQNSFIEITTVFKNTGNDQSNQPNQSNQSNTEQPCSSSQTQEGLEQQTETKIDPVEEKKSTTEEPVQKPEPVCLVPNIPKLGYIKGERWEGSVTIQHPLKPDKKLKLQDINNDLNTMLRAKLTYAPQDLAVQWKVVEGDSFKSRAPLDKSLLDGTYILSNKGPLPIASPKKRKGINAESKKAIDGNSLIQEIMSLEDFGNSLTESEECTPSDEDLSRLVAEIEELDMESIVLKTKKMEVEKERQKLCRKLLRTLNNFVIDDEKMKPVLEYTDQFLKKNKKKTLPNSENPSERENFDFLRSLDNSLRSIAVSPVLKQPVKKPKVNPALKKRKEIKNDPETCSTETVTCENEKVAVEKKADNKKLEEWNRKKVEKLQSKINSLYEAVMQTNTGDDVRKGMEDKLLTMSEHVKKVKSACKSKKKAKHSSAAPNKANQTDVHSEKSVPANAESEKDAITSGSQVETKDLKEKSSNANESNGEDATEPKIPQKKTPANDLDTSSVEVEAKKPGGKICKRPEDSPVKPGESLLKTSSEKPPMVVSPLKINRIECVSGLNKGKQIFVIKKRKDKETINSESPKKFKDIHN